MLRVTLQGLDGVPEFVWPGGTYSQAAVDARWAQIGAPLPAPLVPESMLGAKMMPSRGARVLKLPDGKKRGVNSVENDFLNYFGKVAIDPYRKQTDISKVGGVILQVVGAIVPIFGIAQAAQGAVALAQQKGEMRKFADLQDRALATSFAQIDADSAALTQAQIDKIRAAGISVSSVVPSSSVKTPAKVLGLNQSEQLAVGALGAALLLYLLARK